MNRNDAPGSFAWTEYDQLRIGVSLSADRKIDFFEEMIQIAYASGALHPERLALRDKQVLPATQNDRTNGEH